MWCKLLPALPQPEIVDAGVQGGPHQPPHQAKKVGVPHRFRTCMDADLAHLDPQT